MICKLVFLVNLDKIWIGLCISNFWLMWFLLLILWFVVIILRKMMKLGFEFKNNCGSMLKIFIFWNFLWFSLFFINISIIGVDRDDNYVIINGIFLI